MSQRDAADAADFNTNFVAKLHNDLKIDNERFTMLSKFCVALYGTSRFI
jgi:hypothetical protein